MSRVEQTSSLPERSLGRFSISQFCLAVGLLGASIALGVFIKAMYREQTPPLESGPQPHYAYLAANDSARGYAIAAWFELGRDGKLIQQKSQRAEYSLTLQDFSIGSTWKRTVHWHVAAGDHGSMTLRFPKRKLRRVAVFMSDGDTAWRSSIVRSSGETRLAERLHQGKWLFFDVSPQDSANGEKHLGFQRLTGNSISISAVVLLE